MKNIHNLNIKVLGFWNKKIFQPRWFYENVPELKKKKTIDAMFNPARLEMGYNVQGVQIFPSDYVLDIRIEKEFLDEKRVVFATELLMTILSRLPHTPIQGIGFNVILQLKKQTKNKFINILNKKGNDLGEIKVSEIRHIIKKPQYSINIISSSLPEGGYRLIFNFDHKELKKEIVKDTFLKHIQEAQELII